MDNRAQGEAWALLTRSQQRRFAALALTPGEIEDFVSYLCGYAPFAVKRGLDTVESDRAYAAARKAAADG